MDNDLINYIAKIKEGTIAKKIIWNKAQDKAFIWPTKDSHGNPLNLILQEVATNDGKKIIFRIWDKSSKRAMFEILTNEIKDPKIESELFNLFEFVSTNYKIDNLDILGDLLRDI